jgi:hypothetical protein
MNIIDQKAISDFVRREVILNVTYILSKVASLDCEDLDEAVECFIPVMDYEEAATDDGWELETDEGIGFINVSGAMTSEAVDWQGLCEEEGIDPYEREVFEAWVVSDYLAQKLESLGERVVWSVCGLGPVWGRTTTGQAISMDYVIEEAFNNA